ncbi:MAG: XRE family transcriptional regulator [Actinomycetota bacterium]|nr:XRE family transcriptional regulator [Actinomycetota bacterium]
MPATGPDDEHDLEAAIGSVIANRVRGSRLDRNLTVAQLAERTEISKGMISKIENAQASPSLSTLARLAMALDVPVTSFFRGLDEEREAVFVAAGQGAEIVGAGTQVGHRYELLGVLRGPTKRAEPVLITLTERSEVFPLFQHPGVEILHMLEGTMEYGYGSQRYVMRPGDTLQFDGETTHGPTRLDDLPIRFLSIKVFPT